jgi:putative endonuclease
MGERRRASMYIVYILQSETDSSFYTGFTSDLEKRIAEHNQGKAQYSSSKGPFRLVWHCVFHDKVKAILFEKYLKSGSGIAFSRKRFI